MPSYSQYSPGTLRGKVAHAYYRYGRYCASHPYLNLLVSSVVVLLFSFPILRLTWFFDLTNESFQLQDTTELQQFVDKFKSENTLELFVQNVFVRARWTSLQSAHAISSMNRTKCLLNTAFDVNEVVDDFIHKHGCFAVGSIASNRLQELRNFMPENDCFVGRGPVIFWGDSREALLQHPHPGLAIYRRMCGAFFCTFDIPLLGVPFEDSGLSKFCPGETQNNSFEYSFGIAMDPREPLENLLGLLPNLSARFHSEGVRIYRLPQFVPVTFRQYRYDWMTNSSWYYVLPFLLVYAYITLRKYGMMKSPLLLAFSATFTISFSIVVTAGVFTVSEYSPKTQLSAWFPLIAMFACLENVLLFTRAILITPSNLHTNLRVAHGLSREGWNMIRNFLIEQTILLVGYCTRIAEVQEFALFGMIALLSSFFMELMFYLPILVFDLKRLTPNERNSHRSAQIMDAESVRLETFPEVQCPFKALFRRPIFFLFQHAVMSSRRPSEERFDDSATVSPPPRPNWHQRIFNRRWRRRYFQPIYMVISAVWITYIASEVQKRKMVEDFGTKFRETLLESTGTPAYFPSALQNARFIRAVPKIWRASLYQYGVDLYGKSAVILSPIIMDIPVTAEKCHTVLDAIPAIKSEMKPPPDHPHVKTVTWMEFHLLTITLMSCGMLTLVAAFVCYVFFCNGKSLDRIEARTTIQYAKPQVAVKSIPVRMVGHLGRIECVTAAAGLHTNIVVSSDLKHRVLMWNSSTGECLEELELPPTDHPVIPVWAIDASESLVGVGYKNGMLALFDVCGGRLIGEYGSQSGGVIHLKLLPDKAGTILARYPGSIEALYFAPTNNGRVDINVHHAAIAHQQLITVLQVTGSRIYTGSCDYTIKMFNVKSVREILPTLVGHRATISSILIDDKCNALISSCFAGMICVWDLATTRLNYRISDCTNAGNSAEPLSLALTQRFLVGVTSDFSLWIWRRNSGDLITRIKQTEKLGQKSIPLVFEPKIIAIKEDMVAVGGGKRVQIWDLASKMLMKETNFSGLKSSVEFVQHMMAVNENQAICCSFGTLLYRVAMPTDRV